MIAAVVVFWACVLLTCYAWFGYPMLLWLLSRFCKGWERSSSAVSSPSITVVIAVHNEETVLAERIANCFETSYPPDKLEVIVASDGSTDGTVSIANELAEKYRSLRVYARTDRVGKSAVQNAAVRLSKGEIIVFSDVDTRFDPTFLERLLSPFGVEEVGGVTGALVSTNAGESAIAGGTDYYWRYEHALWRWESHLGLLAWGSGPCLAVRRELLKPMDVQYGEDCIVPLDVVSLGYRVVFQPTAIAREGRMVSPEANMRARVRMTLRSFAGTVSRKHLLNPLRFPAIAWSVISHKLLRWLTPYLLLLTLAANVFVADRPFYRATLAAQVFFYISAVMGYILDRRQIRWPVVSTIYAFCLMNIGVLVGVARAVFGHRILAYRSEPDT